jgi:hypothetical protein
MKKQTAVEYLIESIFNESELQDPILKLAITLAKAMEKEQMMDAWDNGMKSDNGHFGTKEQYYNETYNK